MKVFFVYLLMMHDQSTGRQIVGVAPTYAHEISTAFVHEGACQDTAKDLNAKAGSKRGFSWECKKQGVER